MIMIDTEKLKAIKPEVVLKMLNIRYKHIRERIMATAEWRGEQNPSISIQEKGGHFLWKDFGTGKGGSWIDLVISVKSLSYLDALLFLNNIENAEINTGSQEKRIFSFSRQERKSNNIEITAINKITDEKLINYLHSRAISNIPSWLKQINYKVIKGDKTYQNKALGIENRSGGYAIRNSNIKMNIGKSSYALFIVNSGIALSG